MAYQTDQLYVNVVYWGADPTGTVDSAPAINAAINYCIDQKKSGIVKIPVGTYIIDSPILILKDINADNDPDFVTIALEGEGNNYDGNQTLGGATVISATFADTFALGIQHAKNVSVSNIYFLGVNQINLSNANLVTGADSVFSTASSRDQRYSPYSGICIDPFGTSVPADGGYPGYTSSYGVVGQGGSTNVRINNCRINGFIGGITVSPNGTTANAEAVTINDCRIDKCKVVYINGQDQALGHKISNLTAWTNIKTVFDTANYGNTIGVMPDIYGANIVGCRFIFEGKSSWTSLSAHDINAEAFYSIGYMESGSLPITFSNCKFNPWTASAITGVKVSPALFQANNATFIGGEIQYYEGAQRGAIGMDVKELDMYNVYLENSIINNTTDSGEHFYNVNYRNCHILYRGGSDQNYTNDSTIWNINLVNVNDVTLAPNQQVQVTDNGSTDVFYKSREKPYRFNTGNQTITVDDVNMEFVFTATDVTDFRMGDVIITAANNTSDPQGLGVHTVMGYVSDITVSDVTVSNIPYGISTGVINVGIYRAPKVAEPCFGDVASGSPTLSNINTETGNITNVWSAGDVIQGDGIPSGTYVVSVDNGAKTVTMSKDGTANNTGEFIYSDNLIATAYKNIAPTDGSWAPGTEVRNTRTNTANSDVYSWICTEGGVFGSGKVPVFREVTINGLNPDNAVAATVLGSVTDKIEAFDKDGNSIGFVPVYDSIT